MRDVREKLEGEIDVNLRGKREINAINERERERERERNNAIN